MIRVVISPEYCGPGILDDLWRIRELNAPIEVLWTNTKQEIAALEEFEERDALLHVRDVATAERTASSLGTHYVDHKAIFLEGMNALTSANGKWREFVAKHGQGVARMLLLHNAASAIRQGAGGKTASFRKVVLDCFLEGVSPADVDALLALRARCQP